MVSSLTTAPFATTEREHQGFRLDGRLVTLIEDLATGVEEGDAGLKSCTMGAVSAAAAGATAAQVNAAHHRELAVIEDEDECFDAIGDLLAQGFSHGEIAKMVTLGGGATHLLAVERWCDRVRLGCDADHDAETKHQSLPWSGSALHERRRRARRAIAVMRQTSSGCDHVAVLFIVYGHPDPMLMSAKKFMHEQETAPAGEPPKLDPADRAVFNLAKSLLEMGNELAPLARYTATVEARRLEMVHLDAARRLRRVDGVIPLADHRARTAHAERILSSTDALRDGLAPAAPKRDDEERAEYEDRLARARAERLVFVSAVKMDANRMLTDASTAFRDAWLRA